MNEVKESTREANKVEVKPEIKNVYTKSPTLNVGESKVGLINKQPYSVHVILSKDDFILSPSQRTGKEFKLSDILFVNNMPLDKAINAGLISLIR